jgi:hypothetical protein
LHKDHSAHHEGTGEGLSPSLNDPKFLTYKFNQGLVHNFLSEYDENAEELFMIDALKELFEDGFSKFDEEVV